MLKKRKAQAAPDTDSSSMSFKRTATITRAGSGQSTVTASNMSSFSDRYANIVAPWDRIFKHNLVLLVSIDFGTATSAVTTAMIPRGLVASDPTRVNLMPIELDGDQELLLTQVAILPEQSASVRSAKLIFGTMVDDELRNGNITPQHIFRNLKQSKCFVDPERPSMASALKQQMRDLHKAHYDTLKLWKRFDKIYLEHPTLRVKEIIKFDNMKDVVGLFLSYLIMETKKVIRKRSNMSWDLLSDLFEGKLDTLSGPKVRFGIAVPELWKQERLKLYNLVRERAFVSPYLEILSESKCAAAMMLLEKVNTLPSDAVFERETMIKDLSNAYFMNVDIGGHTLDISTMKICLDGSLVKLRIIGESTSTEDGAERANEAFRSRLTDFLGPQGIDAIATSMNTSSRRDVEEGFVRGFEHCKKRFDPSNSTKQLVSLTYQGAKDLPAGRHGMVNWGARVLKIPFKQFLNCLKDPAKQMLKADGPILSHLKATQELAGDNKVEVLFSGGGSRSAVVRQEIERKIEFAKYGWSEVGLAAESLVSKGGILVLADPQICRDVKTSRKSYGVRVTVDYDAGNPVHRSRKRERVPNRDLKRQTMELPNTAMWRHRFTDLCRTDPDMDDYMMTVLELEDDPAVDTSELAAEIEIVQSEHGEKGIVDGYAVDDEDITTGTILKVPISKRLAISLGATGPEAADQIVKQGFSRGDDNIWRLYFHYRVVFYWCNILQFWEVQIPHGGYFRKPNKDDEVHKFHFTLTGDCVLAADDGNEHCDRP